MKKKLLITALFILLLLGISTISYGAISATSKTINSGENVTISVSSSEALGAYTITVTNNGGLTFISSSPVAGAVANGTTISGSSSVGVTSLGSFTFKAPTVTSNTTYTVKISSTGTEGPNFENISPSTATATITVKAPVQNPTPTPPPAPTFSNASGTLYSKQDDVNVRSSYSTASKPLGQLKKGESVTRTGISTTSVNGYKWIRVTYKGQTGYVAESLLTTTKPAEEPAIEPSAEPSTPPEETTNDAKLKSLSIVGVELTPEFNPDVTSYSANIDEEVTQVEVVAEVNNEKTKYEVAGNKELKDGENTVTITVTAEDGTVTTYEIKLLKNVEPAPIEDNTNDTPVDTNKAETRVNYKLIVIISAIVLITLIGIAFAIACYKKQDNTEYAKPDYSFLREDEEKQKNTLEQIYDEKNKNDDDNDNFRRGGRHF